MALKGSSLPEITSLTPGVDFIYAIKNQTTTPLSRIISQANLLTPVPLLAGRIGGQIYNGGLNAGDNAIYNSTADPIKGKHIFGANDLVVDEVNNRVGIKTITPQTALQVGAPTITAADISDNPGGISDIKALVSSNTALQSVSYNLHVEDGSRNSRVKFFMDDNTANNGAWGLWQTFSSGGAQPFVIGQGTSGEVFRIETDGKVGIRTQTPSQALDLIGALELEDTTTSTTGVIYKGADRFIHNFHDLIGGGAVPDGLNTFVGINAGNFTIGSTATSTEEGSCNTGLGESSLLSLTIGSNNTGIGVSSLFSLTIGSRNTGIGVSSLRLLTIGSNNTGLGNGSLRLLTIGSRNTGIGDDSLFALTIGDNNNSIGRNSLFSLTTGSNNCGIGFNAGRFIADGSMPNETTSTSVYIGNDTKASADGVANENVFGFEAIGIGSNTVVLGNDSIVTTLLKGNVGIGVIPTVPLDVLGNVLITGNLAITGTVDGINIATDVPANTTHRTSDGSDHTFLDQSVISGAAPIFGGVNISGVDATLLDGIDSVEFLQRDASVALTVNWDVGNFDLTMKSLTMDGNFVLQSATNSLTAFQVRDNDGGVPVFNVDTINERVGIGIAVPNAPFEVFADTPGSVGGFASGAFQITSPSSLINANAVITGHNSFDGNKQLWYFGSVSSSNDNIAFINRQNGAIAFLSNNITRLTIENTGNITLADTVDMAFNATTGTKIGTATGQKIGFWNATPVIQQSHIADPSGGATVDAESRTAINSILAQLATLGLQAIA